MKSLMISFRFRLCIFFNNLSKINTKYKNEKEKLLTKARLNLILI